MKEQIKPYNMLPCPFCGNTDGFAIRWNVYNYYNVCCPCGAMGPFGDTRKKAIAAWNKYAEPKVKQ
jgi:Lar family restriction alleviation protein